MSQTNNSNTLTPEEVLALADRGSRSVYKMSLEDLAKSLATAGKPLDEEGVTILAKVGAAEEGEEAARSNAKPSNHSPVSKSIW